jgi:ADP-ribosylation factor-binding protein GGA
MFNSGVNNLAGVEFQAAVPKSMKVKLQAPTGRDLPPFNPLVPPTSIKQIMLISNPSPTKVKLKYRLKFKSNSVDVLESGDISDFPY